MKKINLAYIAGFFDGEGSVNLMPLIQTTAKQQQMFSLRAQVMSTNKRSIERLKNDFGGDIKCNPIKGNRQESWTWRVTAKQAVSFLRLVLPYLQIKKPQAQLAIKFQKHKIRGGHKTYKYLTFERDTKNKFSIMNKRGRDAMISHGLIAAA